MLIPAPFGSMTALVTPFRNGVLDENTFASLVKRQINNKIDAVVVAGTTGESPTLSKEERLQCIKIAVELCKNTSTKVVSGAGSNNTKLAVELSKMAQNAGSDAVLSITPYYNKPTNDGLYEHYKSIATAIDIPIMLYNVPSRTGVSLDMTLASRLFRDFKNIYGIKDASGSLERVLELRNIEPSMAIFSGEDLINYPILSSGGKGVVSVVGNLLPDRLSEVVRLALEGRFEESKEAHQSLFDITIALFMESNPLPIKAAMYLAGLLPELEYRLPLVKPSNKTLDEISKILEKYEVIK